MSAKDSLKRPKRPDMAIYTPRGRRAQEEVKQSPDDVNQSQPPKTTPKGGQQQSEHNISSLRDKGDPDKVVRLSEEPDDRHRTPRVSTEKDRGYSEEHNQHRPSKFPAMKSREESNQHHSTRVFTAKNREHLDDPRQRRTSKTPTERSRRFSDESDHASVASHRKGKSTINSATVSNGHGPPGAARSPPSKPRGRSALDEGEPERPRNGSAVGSDDRAIDLTVKPVDLSVKSAEEQPRGAAPSPPTQRHRDPSPGGRRRPRGAAGVYVPRAARRHCDSTGRPPSPSDDGAEPSVAPPARQDGGDAVSGSVSRAGPNPQPSRTTSSRRRRDSDRPTGKADGEKKRTPSSQSTAREEKDGLAKDDSLNVANRVRPRDEDPGGSSSRPAARVEDRESPPAPVSRPLAVERSGRRVEPALPQQVDLASLTLEPAPRQPPVPVVRRSVRSDLAEAAPSSGLLYVPGGPHSDPPEPPLSHAHSNSNSTVHSRSHSHSYPTPPSRHLYDPNNPSRAVEVTPRANDARNSRYQEACRTYSDPYSGGGPPAAAGLSEPFSLTANSTNANRISQLLGRAAGEIEFLITSGRLLSSWAIAGRIRLHVQVECSRVLVSDLRTWMTLGIDQTIWRSLYYCVIEELRAIEPADQQRLLHEIIDDGMDFFSRLMTLLQETYDIPVYHLSSLIFDPEKIRQKRYFSSVAALSQRLLLCLGDLTRYQHQLGRLSNLVQAHTFYLQAQHMNPKNGRPFNQLAIVALYGHRRLDCVYLYARALMAANPFHTAKESLLSLFHESSRRYAAHRPMPGQVVASAAELPEKPRGADLRTETWVHPGRGDRLQRTLRTDQQDTPPEQPELRRTPDAELLKAFTTTYLHVQGKLYTRVSLETYQEDACVMLRQFSELLSRDPMPLKSADMLHILGINMFNIANTKLKDERLGSELRSTYQELALAVAIEMAGHVIQRACQLLATPRPADGGGPNERLFTPYALETCMVFVKVWCDWLLSSSAVWNPPPCTADYRVSGVADCWASLAELTNLLRLQDGDDTRHRPSNTLNNTSSGEQDELVVRLPEDACLESFTPLLCGERRTMFVHSEVCGLERARDLLRLRCVLFVTEQFLCGTEPAALRLLKTAQGACHYVSQVSSHAPADAEGDQRAESPDVQVEWVREEEEEEEEAAAPAELPPLPAAASRPELALLQQQKLALERRARRQEEHDRRVQAIVSSAHTSVTLEVRPRYLVADTNCYVDYLEQLQSLVTDHNVYTLTVPVTVLAELDGLSRPGGGGRPRPGQSEEHVQLVRRTARAALAFVQQRGAPHVRCVTSRGHLISSAVFTAEDDDDEQATNDDRILSCCRHLERGVAEERPDGGQHLSREVVLLTDDRNLRLKALSLDVPTRTVPDFLAWAS